MHRQQQDRGATTVCGDELGVTEAGRNGNGTAHAKPRCHACGQPVGFWATDKLTGLLDRWGWDEQAPRALAGSVERGRGAALLVIDFDHFKQVNDLHGHLAGDAVLTAMGKVLVESTRAGDVVSRLGGDEFAVLMPDTSLDEAVAVAERVGAAVRGLSVLIPLGLNGTTIGRHSASIGLAASPEHGGDLRDLLLRADSALLAAKRQGRDQVRIAD